jgi:zinc protease
VTLVDRPGSQQSEIRIGAVGLARGDDDEIPVLVMNAILGGLFSSRINLNLREDKGWTYGARSGFSLRRAPGPFVASAAVETPVTARAFEEMLFEIRSMTERPPSEDELALARNALILSLPRQFETTSQVASKEAERVAYDLPPDWWERFPARVGQVGRDEVVRVAERYLDPAGLVLVAVGDAAALRSDLSSLGRVTERPVP